MAYEYYGPRRGMGALGFSNPRATCTEVSNGETRCFRPTEVSAATSHNCRSLNSACQVGGDNGTMYCCPQFGATRAPTTTTASQSQSPQDSEAAPQTILGQGWEWFQEVIGAKGQAQPAGQQQLPMPGATPDGKPSASGFSEYAREAAVREVASVDEELAPIEEAPSYSPDVESGDERSWIERHQTHITLVSTVVGLGTFIIWLAVRKKD